MWYCIVKPNTTADVDATQCDATVKSSRVKVLTHCAVCIEFATSSRRLPTDLVENVETEHAENLSRPVELCRQCACARQLSRPSLQFCSHRLWVTIADGCVHTADTTQLDFVVCKFVQIHRDCRQLSATRYTPPMQLNSTVALRRRGVLGFMIHATIK